MKRNSVLFSTLIAITAIVISIFIFNLHIVAQRSVNWEQLTASVPEWGTLWNSLNDQEIAGDKTSKIVEAITTAYPIGSPSSRIFSDCQRLQYAYVPKTALPKKHWLYQRLSMPHEQLYFGT